jgi:threonine aldolase
MTSLNKIIDFRSDTVTKPTPGMLQAMLNAETGDDVFGEDPTVNRLEETAAYRLGFEAGLFCPSGTMTNQIAIKVHTQPGDEVICDYLSHVYQYEGGGIAFHSGASVKTLQGDRGRLTANQVAEAINAIDIHKAKSSLVVLENTSNRGGGSCYLNTDIQSIKNICSNNNLKLHLDGARLFNAIIAQKEDPLFYGKAFDSVSICLSKGLGCPVGSLLLGSGEFIKKARRIRKLFGGGMRQAGILAAAGIYALDNQIQRLEQDHIHARLLEEAIVSHPAVENVLPAETNILIFTLKEGKTAASWVADMKNAGILGYAIAPQQVRLVTHLDISKEMVDHTINWIRSYLH